MPANKIPDVALRADVERVADIVGHPPTIEEYREHGDYAYLTVVRRFDGSSWPGAMRALGYDYEASSIDRADLVADVERVAEELGRPPRSNEYQERGKYGHTTVCRRFGGGSWEAAMQELGYPYPREHQGAGVTE